ncbi:MAG: hypothetical protein JXR37_00475 [Kiritimatiellae bacterium]|nr:hypothetical protein [Kiritimatiellia bacterium]
MSAGRWALRGGKWRVIGAASTGSRRWPPFDVLDSLAGAMEENSDLLAAERRALVQCVQRLPSSQRELLHMRYHAGRSLQELAGSL